MVGRELLVNWWQTKPDAWLHKRWCDVYCAPTWAYLLIPKICWSEVWAAHKGTNISIPIKPMDDHSCEGEGGQNYLSFCEPWEKSRPKKDKHSNLVLTRKVIISLHFQVLKGTFKRRPNKRTRLNCLLSATVVLHVSVILCGQLTFGQHLVHTYTHKQLWVCLLWANEVCRSEGHLCDWSLSWWCQAFLHHLTIH